MSATTKSSIHRYMKTPLSLPTEYGEERERRRRRRRRRKKLEKIEEENSSSLRRRFPTTNAYACLRRLPHQESRIVDESTHDVAVSVILAPLRPTHLLPQHRGIDLELEFVLRRHTSALDFGQIDGIGEVLVAEAIFPAFRRCRLVVRRRLDELVDVHVGGEVDLDRKSTRLNSSHSGESRMPSSA